MSSLSQPSIHPTSASLRRSPSVGHRHRRRVGSLHNLSCASLPPPTPSPLSPYCNRHAPTTTTPSQSPSFGDWISIVADPVVFCRLKSGDWISSCSRSGRFPSSQIRLLLCLRVRSKENYNEVKGGRRNYSEGEIVVK